MPVFVMYFHSYPPSSSIGIFNVIVSFPDQFRSIVNIEPDFGDSVISPFTDTVAAFAQDGILKLTGKRDGRDGETIILTKPEPG